MDNFRPQACYFTVCLAIVIYGSRGEKRVAVSAIDPERVDWPFAAAGHAIVGRSRSPNSNISPCDGEIR